MHVFLERLKCVLSQYRNNIASLPPLYDCASNSSVVHLRFFFFFVKLGFIPGVDARFKTKSAYMKFNCESRMRGYMKEVKPIILLLNPETTGTLFNSLVLCLCSQVVEATKTIPKAKVRAEFLKASTRLLEMLKAAKYNGCNFDRTEEEPHRLCTQEGWFTCQVLKEESHIPKCL